MERNTWLGNVLRFTLLATALMFVATAPRASADTSPSAAARRALNVNLPELNLTGATLVDALQFIQDVSGANMHVNWPALEAAGVSKDAQVNVRLQRITTRKALDMVLNEAGAGTELTYYVDDGVIEVTTRELADQIMVTRVYPVDDLIMEIPDFNDAPDFNLDSGGGGGGGGTGGSPFGGGGDGGGQDQGTSRAERAEALIDMIVNTIRPDVWQVNGGTAAIRFFNGSLIVTAPRSVHEALGGPAD